MVMIIRAGLDCHALKKIHFNSYLREYLPIYLGVIVNAVCD
jgi:hypothetical protein